MGTIEQFARAWTDLGRVLYPSLAEVEAALAEVGAALAAAGKHDPPMHRSEED